MVVGDKLSCFQLAPYKVQPVEKKQLHEEDKTISGNDRCYKKIKQGRGDEGKTRRRDNIGGVRSQPLRKKK